MAKKQSKKTDVPHLRLSTPEGIGYIAFEGDPLFDIRTVAADRGLALNEAVLPLHTILSSSSRAALATAISTAEETRRNLIRQLEKHGSKLDLEEIIALVARLRSEAIQSLLLRELQTTTRA